MPRRRIERLARGTAFTARRSLPICLIDPRRAKYSSTGRVVGTARAIGSKVHARSVANIAAAVKEQAG